MYRLLFVLLASVAAVPAIAGDIKVINDKAAFPEGPAFVDGKLHYVEYGGNTIDVWDGTTNTVLWKSDGCGPSAVLPLGSGDLVVTCYDNGTIARVSRDGKTVASYDKDKNGGVLQGPNDLAADGKGGVYFTASGPWESGPIVGKVFHLADDGTIVEVANDLHYANGIVMAADGKRLFVRVGVVDEASGIGAYPDGIKLGPDGNFYIGQYSKGRIVVVDKDAKFVKAIDLPSPTAPNMAFSPDGKLLYVMSVDDTAKAPYWGKVYEVPLQ